MHRRHLLACAATLPWLTAHAAALPRIVVLEAEMVDDHDNPATRTDQARRLPELAALLRRELAAQRLYEVVDAAPAAELIARLTSQHASLHDCDPCSEDIGRALATDLVMTPWIYKVSELILMLNLQIYSVRAGRLVHMKGVQMRGNRDDSWARAATYLVRDMAEHRAANAAYGQ